MSMEALAFYFFAVIATAAALAVVLSRNPVHSVLYLILAFFSAAGLFVLLGAEFLAMLLVIVYVGAVAVLFLFVVMMLDVDFTELKRGFASYLPFGGFLALIVFAQLFVAAQAVSGDLAEKTPDARGAAPTNAEAIGAILYTENAFAFQIAGLILLVAMVGAVVLTLRERTGVKHQDVSKQVGRKRADAVAAVDVKPGQGAI